MSPARIATKQLPIGDLHPYPANPRRGDVAAIRESLEANGQYRALVVRADTLEVLAGNHTLAAMRELGYEKALVHLVDVDEEQAKRIVIADNRTNDLASYDERELADLLGSLDGDIAGTGWDEKALVSFMAQVNGPGEDTEPSEPPRKPRTKLGDLWALGEHRVLCGDALERLPTVPPVDLVVTDPPYVIGAVSAGNMGSKAGGWGDMMNSAGWFRDWYALVRERLSREGAMWTFCNWRSIPVVMRAAFDAEWSIESLLVWHKDWIGPGGMVGLRPAYELVALMAGDQFAIPNRGLPDVWTEKWSSHKPNGHPAEKPVALLERIIDVSGTAKGALVLDPFAGSGSTLIACENLSRRCYAMEIDPGYCDVIVDRWERHTGKQATLEAKP